MSWLDNLVVENVIKKYHTEGQFGIEIEIEGKGLPYDALRWRVERDSSLKGIGDNLEYVLDRPASLEEVKKDVLDLYSLINLGGGEVFDSMRAGIHVHVNMQQMNIRQMFTFMAIYWIFEDIIIPMFGEDRIGNLFCLRLTDADYINDIIETVLVSKSIRLFNQNNTYKYGALNTECTCKYGSLEFRAMQTPQDPSKIIRWLEMIKDLLNYSLTIKDPVELLGKISGNDIEEFIKGISPDLWDLARQTPNYECCIFNSIRNIQFWVYKSDWN